MFLNDCEEVQDLAFICSATSLKQLALNGTKVTNLQPLETLQALEQVGANSTGVNKLPQKTMPRLEWLRVMESALNEEDLKRFKQLNPSCKISSGWKQVFDLSMVGVTRVRVRSGGTCHVNVTKEKTLFESSDAATVNGLLDLIVIDEEHCGFHCMCCGEPTFEFYKGGVLFASIGFHHGQSLRWADGEWPGDAGLTRQSADALVAWLDEHGVSGPLEERAYAEKAAREAERAWEKWEKATPECLLDFPSTDSPIGRDKEQLKKMNARLEKAYPYINNRILALLGWYGSGKGPWSGYPSYESEVEKLLMLYSTMEILQSVDGVQLTTPQMEGLARFLGGWSFGKQRKGDRELIPANLKRQLLEYSLKSNDEDKKSRARNAFEG